MLEAYCRLVSCLARSAAASADLELDALLLLREVIAVRDKNNTATIFECGADRPCVELSQFIRRDISSYIIFVLYVRSRSAQGFLYLKHRNMCIDGVSYFQTGCRSLRDQKNAVLL